MKIIKYFYYYFYISNLEIFLAKIILTLYLLKILNLYFKYKFKIMNIKIFETDTINSNLI